MLAFLFALQYYSSFGSSSASSSIRTEMPTGDIVVGRSMRVFEENDFVLQKYSVSLGLQCVRQIGSSVADAVIDMCVDYHNNVYYAVSYCTTSFDGNTAFENEDFCFGKCGADGSKKFSGQIGGTGGGSVNAIAIERMGKYFYITTFSDSLNGTAKIGNADTVWLKYDAVTDKKVALEMYYDGETYNNFGFYSIALDSFNNSIITGSSASSYRSFASKGSYDVIYTKYSSDGTFIKADLQGGSDFDKGLFVAMDTDDNAYLVAYSFSPIVNGQTNHGSTDILLLKYDSAGLLQYTVMAGGDDSDSPNGAIVDNINNKLYIAGSTQSTSFYGNTDGSNGCAFLLGLSLSDGSVKSSGLFCDAVGFSVFVGMNNPLPVYLASDVPLSTNASSTSSWDDSA